MPFVFYLFQYLELICGRSIYVRSFVKSFCFLYCSLVNSIEKVQPHGYILIDDFVNVWYGNCTQCPLLNASPVFFHNWDVSPQHNGQLRLEVSAFTSVRRRLNFRANDMESLSNIYLYWCTIFYKARVLLCDNMKTRCCKCLSCTNCFDSAKDILVSLLSVTCHLN